MTTEEITCSEEVHTFEAAALVALEAEYGEQFTTENGMDYKGEYQTVQLLNRGNYGDACRATAQDYSNPEPSSEDIQEAWGAERRILIHYEYLDAQGNIAGYHNGIYAVVKQ